jgi:hypothetical protein
MKASGTIYLVGIIACLYSLPTIVYSLNVGNILSGSLAVVLLIGAIGCFMKKSWSQYPIYFFSILVVPTWLIHTARLIMKQGWPYYATNLESIIGLLPGIFLCVGCVFSSWAVFSFFRPSRTQGNNLRSSNQQ